MRWGWLDEIAGRCTKCGYVPEDEITNGYVLVVIAMVSLVLVLLGFIFGRLTVL